MSYKYKIKESDYVNAGLLNSKFNNKDSLLSNMVLVIIVTVLNIYLDISILYSIVGCLIVWLMIHIIRKFTVPYLLKKQYSEYDAVKELQYLELKKEGIDFSTKDAKMLLKWKQILKWRQNSRYLLLYQNSGMYHIIIKPIKNDEFDIDALTKILIEKVGNET